MRVFKAVLFSAAIASLSLAQSSFGAAQLAAGASTSAKPTATNPQQRQIQISFDPVISDPSAAINPYSLTDFRLSVSFDPTLVTLNDVVFYSPYTENVPPENIEARPAAIPAPGAASQYYTLTNINTNTDYIGNVSGSAAQSAVPAGQDVYIFYADFTLNGGVSMDTPLPFTIFANPNDEDSNGNSAPDFTQGTNSIGGTVTTPPTGTVAPTTDAESFNQATADVDGTPLPAGAWGGLLLIGSLGGVYARRRLRAAVS